ncbi:MAG: DUF721 domain-containing protein [Gammaproteobacteria bacterium]|nr:DUF721 domain-containing protein [Gammaproteobacteria bacterium]
MAKRLGALIHPSLVGLKSQIDAQLQLEVLVKTLLPDTLGAYCRVSRFVQGCLTLAVTDAVWMALLRYQLPELRDKLRQDNRFSGLRSIDLEMQPAMNDMERKKPLFVERPLSAIARESIQETSEHIVYEPLSRALKHLL